MNESASQTIKDSCEAFFAPQQHEYGTTQRSVDYSYPPQSTREPWATGEGPKIVLMPQDGKGTWDLYETERVNVSAHRILYIWTWVRVVEAEPTQLDAVRAVLQAFDQRKPIPQMSQLATATLALSHCLDVIDAVKAAVR